MHARTSRRQFLQVGASGLIGLSLPDLLRSRARASSRGERPRETAVIQVFLNGGPSHLETYDPKPDAPLEFRGDLGSIATALPGVRLGAQLPRHARILDKISLIRSLHHTTSDHPAGTHWLMTGIASSEPNPRSNERPSVGSIAARLRGASRPGLPAYVAVPDAPAYAASSYLGPGFNPFSLDRDPNVDARVPNLDPPAGVGLDRIADRRGLLARLDRFDRRRDISGTMAGMDRFTAEAYAMISGPAARAAFDLGQEPAALRDRYGRTPIGQGCLLARRLVEAGVTFVTINEANWDHHTDLFARCRAKLPPLDAAIATLVEDLCDRGLDKRVLLLVWGEFGRTPRVNGTSGRDHWPGAFSALMAGGGLRMGRVVGATGIRGEAPTENPVRPEDVVQTVYHVLGINPSHEFQNDAGRPLAVLGQGKPIAELI
jgi:uncharacterized protein (DUF1501 family)